MAATIIDPLLADLIVSYSCLSEYASLAETCKSFYDVIAAKNIEHDPAKFRYVNNCIVILDQRDLTAAKKYREQYAILFSSFPEIIKRLSADLGMYISVESEKLLYGPGYAYTLDFILQRCCDPTKSDGIDYAIRDDQDEILTYGDSSKGLVCINKNGIIVLEYDYFIDNKKELIVLMFGTSIKIPVVPKERIMAVRGNLPMRAIMQLYGTILKLHILPSGDVLTTVLDGDLIRVIKTTLPDSFVDGLTSAVSRRGYIGIF